MYCFIVEKNILFNFLFKMYYLIVEKRYKI